MAAGAVALLTRSGAILPRRGAAPRTAAARGSRKGTGGLQVYVALPEQGGGGGTISVDVGAAATCADLIAALPPGAAADPASVELVWQGEVVPPDATLADVGIGAESVVQLRERGVVEWATDRERCHESYTVSDGGSLAWKTSDGPGVILATGPPLGPKCCEWTLVPEGKVYDCQVGIAVVGEGGISINKWLDSVKQGWSHRACGNFFAHTRREAIEGIEGGGRSGGFKVGDRVTVHYDGGAGTVCWSVNGKKQRTRFHDVPPNVVPAVTLPSQGQGVRLVPT